MEIREELLEIVSVTFVELSAAALEARAAANIKSNFDYYCKVDVKTDDQRKRRVLGGAVVSRNLWPENKSDRLTIEGLKEIIVANKIGGVEKIDDIVVNGAEESEPVTYLTGGKDAILDGWIETVPTSLFVDKGYIAVNSSGHPMPSRTVAVFGTREIKKDGEVIRAASGDTAYEIVKAEFRARGSREAFLQSVVDPNGTGSQGDPFSLPTQVTDTSDDESSDEETK